MTHVKKAVALVASITVLSYSTVGCTNSNWNIKKSDIGTLTGAVGGAWLGSNVGKGKGQIAAIAAGTLLGAALGNSIGASLDKADMAYYNTVSQDTLENAKTGNEVAWRNPDTGTSGTITPVRTYQEVASQRHCREYQQTITVGGNTETGFGTACRQPDGRWKIIN